MKLIIINIAIFIYWTLRCLGLEMIFIYYLLFITLLLYYFIILVALLLYYFITLIVSVNKNPISLFQNNIYIYVIIYIYIFIYV